MTLSDEFARLRILLLRRTRGGAGVSRDEREPELGVRIVPLSASPPCKDAVLSRSQSWPYSEAASPPGMVPEEDATGHCACT